MLLCATAMDRRAASTMWAETERIYPRRAHGKQISGHPAMAMVAGLSSGRLPLLLQFLGRYFAETTLLQLPEPRSARRDCKLLKRGLRATKRVQACTLDRFWTGKLARVIKLLIFLASPTGFEPVLPP